MIIHALVNRTVPSPFARSTAPLTPSHAPLLCGVRRRQARHIAFQLCSARSQASCTDGSHAGAAIPPRRRAGDHIRFSAGIWAWQHLTRRGKGGTIFPPHSITGATLPICPDKHEKGRRGFSTVYTDGIARGVAASQGAVSEAFLSPVIALGVTGLARSARRCSITSRWPTCWTVAHAVFLRKFRCDFRRLICARTRTIPSRVFPFEANLKALTGNPRWPVCTATVSSCVLSDARPNQGLAGWLCGSAHRPSGYCGLTRRVAFWTSVYDG